MRRDEEVEIDLDVFQDRLENLIAETSAAMADLYGVRKLQIGYLLHGITLQKMESLKEVLDNASEMMGVRFENDVFADECRSEMTFPDEEDVDGIGDC